MREPTVTAVVRVFDGERHVAEALDSILAQTRPADEIVVVDDGSTDGTAAILAGYGDRIRVVHQENRGHRAALDRAFEEAHCDYVANCDVDDVWEPDKLARQVAALRAHSEVDVAFGAARLFGARDGIFHPPYPGFGVLEPDRFRHELYRADRICASSAIVRRELFLRLGRFGLPGTDVCEDYDYWLRAAGSGATFFQDDATLVGYRVHTEQASGNVLRMHEGELAVHVLHASLVEPRHARRAQARDLANIGRVLADLDRPAAARASFLSSFRRRPSLRPLVWSAVLSIPGRARRPLSRGLVATRRSLVPSRSSHGTA
ncbi:MAG TPA: glycosyltransferase [Solirubrobacterales bacterium]|nr:glycosyltransferase [Solirubrobacterales bacterium]